MVYRLDDAVRRDKLAEYCRANHIHRMSLFGSALKGTMGPDSDVDLLVEFEEGHVPGLLALAEMEQVLTEILGRKADLRTPGDLSRYFRDEVMREAELQYEA